MGHFAQRVHQHILLRPIEILRQQPVFGRVVAQGVQHRMRHVRLKADGLRPVHHLQQFDHALPAVHASPADLSLGGETLAVIFRDDAGFAKGLRDALGVASGILGPIGR